MAPLVSLHLLQQGEMECLLVPQDWGQVEMQNHNYHEQEISPSMGINRYPKLGWDPLDCFLHHGMYSNSLVYTCVPHLRQGTRLLVHYLKE